MPLLRHLDQATGLPVRKSSPVRYEKQAPGELVHIDIKKLGIIPDGGGWRVHGRGSAQDRRVHVARTRAKRRGANPSRGYAFLHHAVDDCTRLAYSERLPDERKETAAGFAYAKPYASETEREAAYADWLHHYNHHRPHTGLGGSTPAEHVHNLTGNYS